MIRSLLLRAVVSVAAVGALAGCGTDVPTPAPARPAVTRQDVTMVVAGFHEAGLCAHPTKPANQKGVLTSDSKYLGDITETVVCPNDGVIITSFKDAASRDAAAAELNSSDNTVGYFKGTGQNLWIVYVGGTLGEADVDKALGQGAAVQV